jgi:hypothetical protein
MFRIANPKMNKGIHCSTFIVVGLDSTACVLCLSSAVETISSALASLFKLDGDYAEQVRQLATDVRKISPEALNEPDKDATDGAIGECRLSDHHGQAQHVPSASECRNRLQNAFKNARSLSVDISCHMICSGN